MVSNPVIVVFCVRHGQTLLNSRKLFRGNSDPPLDAKGFRDANELAYYFEGETLSFIVSSDKLRARQTAELIHREHDCPYQTTDGLRPWNIGDFGGLPKNAENRERLEYFVQNADEPTPNGESLNEFRQRIRPRLMRAVELASETANPGMLVVHSSVIHEVGETFGGHHEAAHVKPGGVAAVYIQDGKLGCSTVYKPDFRSTTQNVLGTTRRSDTIT